MTPEELAEMNQLLYLQLNRSERTLTEEEHDRLCQLRIKKTRSDLDEDNI